MLASAEAIAVEVNFQIWKKENGTIYAIKEETSNRVNKKLAVVAWLLRMIDYKELISKINPKVLNNKNKVSISNYL